MTIVAAEEWTGHVAIRWWFSTSTPSTDMDIRLQAGLRWSIVDDAGVSHETAITATSPTGGEDVAVEVVLPGGMGDCSAGR